MASEELTQLSKDLANGVTIPAETITETQKPIDLADPIDETDERANLIAESNAAINQIDNDLKLTREKQSSEEEQVSRLIKDLGQKEAFTANLEETSGLTALEGQLSNINSQISAENRLAPARLLQAEKDAEGTGLTMASLGVRMSNRERDNAIRSMVLAAEADIVQGRVDAANARINRAVDAKFKPLENELELRKFNLGRIDKQVESGETKLSTEQQRKYDQQMKKIEKDEAELKTTKDSIRGLSTTIAQNGAPPDVVQAVLGAATVEEAIAAAGEHLKDPMLDIEIALKRQQLANSQIDGEIKQAALDEARNAANGATDEDGNPLVATPDGKLMTESEYEAAQELVNALNEVKNSDKKNMGAAGIAWSYVPLVKSASKDYRKDVNRLKGLLTLDDTSKLTGVLSESDMALLRESASTLSLDQTGSAFDGELARIERQLAQSLGQTFVNDPYGQNAGVTEPLGVADDGMIVIPTDMSMASGGQALPEGMDNDSWWSQEN